MAPLYGKVAQVEGDLQLLWTPHVDSVLKETAQSNSVQVPNASQILIIIPL